MAMDRNGQLLAGPEITSRGFVYVKEADVLMNEADLIVQTAIASCPPGRNFDWNRVKTAVKTALTDFFWKKTMRRPMILPLITEID
jgi:ribonuclease J